MVIGETNKIVSTAGPHFSEKELNQYESVLLVSAGFFCVALIRTVDGSLDFLGYSYMDVAAKSSETANLCARFFDHLPFSLAPCSKIKIGVCGAQSMPVPEFLFDASKIHNLFQSNFGKNAQRPEFVPLSADMLLLYAIPDDVKMALSKLAPSAEVFPIEYYMMSKPPVNGTSHLHCVLSPGHLHIVAYRNDSLVFVNSFSMQTEHDALYHTCNAALRSGFSLHNTQVSICGWLNPAGDYFKHLSRYFESVYADKGHQGVKTDDSMSGINMHYFAPLTYMY